MLEIKDLYAKVGDRDILRGISLDVAAGEVHAIMGPNGSGKSTLAQVLAGNPAYEVTSGTVTFQGKDLLALQPEERAQQGVFLAFQYPIEIPGVSNAYFLRSAFNSIRAAHGKEEVDPIEFLDYMEKKLELVDMDVEMLSRSVNMGFSGGEKKRNEILQMAVLEPKLALLDETDSGLDIDALRIVANGVNALKRPDNATIVVTHYQRLLNYIVPDFVHVLAHGRIVKSGDKSLALELEAKGYDWLVEPQGSNGVTAPYLVDFGTLSNNGARAEPAWLRETRRDGIDRFAALGFPTPRNEDWHFTSVAAIAEAKFSPLRGATGQITKAALAPFTFAHSNWPVMVFVNGKYDASLSTPASLAKGIRAIDLSTAIREEPTLIEPWLGKVSTAEDRSFSALNAAFMSDGAVIHISPFIEETTPLHVIFVSDANAAKGVAHLRNLIVAGHNSKATVIESYVSLGDSGYFTNAVTEVIVEPGATLTHYKIQRESQRAFHVHTIDAKQARDSHYVSFSFATGAALSRTNIYTNLDGEGSGATLNGLYMADDEQHVDHQTNIIHSQPNCFSREIYKGILSGSAHGVFNGKVYVYPIAQKTDGKQTNNNLLLSEGARIDTKPQLEIYADDVRCTHGATVGRLDEMALFYMKSRGVSTDAATRLLTYAFAADVLETIEVQAVRAELERATLERFTGSSAAL